MEITPDVVRRKAGTLGASGSSMHATATTE
jgi:hypothetical protein